MNGDFFFKSVHKLINRMEGKEERISKLEARTIEISQPGQQRKKNSIATKK